MPIVPRGTEGMVSVGVFEAFIKRGILWPCWEELIYIAGREDFLISFEEAKSF